MKFYQFTVTACGIIAAALLTIPFLSIKALAAEIELGCGASGLHLVFSETNLGQYAIYLDEPWTTGDGYIGGADKRKILVIEDHNFKLIERNQPDSDLPHLGSPMQLYAFDKRTAFTKSGDPRWTSKKPIPTWFNQDFNRMVYVVKVGAVNVFPSQNIDAMAAKCYRISITNKFLGRVGENIFYLDRREPRRVFCKELNGKEIVRQLLLPTRVLQVDGVLKGVKRDIGFTVLRRATGFFNASPVEEGFLEYAYPSSKWMTVH